MGGGAGRRLTHLPVLHEQDADGVLATKVEDVNVVLHSHLWGDEHIDICMRSLFICIFFPPRGEEDWHGLSLP